MTATQFEQDLAAVSEGITAWADGLADRFTVEHDTENSRVQVGNIIVDYGANGTSSQAMRDEKSAKYEEGLELYYIYPWDIDSLGSLQSHFNSKLGLDTIKVSARRLEVSQITNKEGNAFAKANHIQKAANGKGKITYGLRDKETGELLAIQQYCHFRWTMKAAGDDAVIWEGLRLVIKNGVHIYGAATRLQNEFVREHSPTHIVSYVDYSHSIGAYKAKQGFVIDDSVKPSESFRWVLMGEPKDVMIIDKHGKERHPQLDLVKRTPYLNPNRIAGAFGKGIGQTFYNGEKLGSRAVLKAQGNQYIHNDEILEAIGYERIHTAGQLRWVLKLDEQN